MDGEKKFMVVAVVAGVICLTVIYVLLFFSLWEYRQWVGASILVILFAAVGVYLRGRLNEQDLRQQRFKHHEETPLDRTGEPMYWHEGMQPNPHRQHQAEQNDAAYEYLYQPQRQTRHNVPKR